jgi:hypothetical protein
MKFEYKKKKPIPFDFVLAVLLACDLVLKNDPRIGRPPSRKKSQTVKKRKPTDKSQSK